MVTFLACLRAKWRGVPGGIAREVVLSSAINIIEIWDNGAYEKVLEETAVDFADLAEEVMGDDGDEVS